MLPITVAVVTHIHKPIFFYLILGRKKQTTTKMLLKIFRTILEGIKAALSSVSVDLLTYL